MDEIQKSNKKIWWLSMLGFGVSFVLIFLLYMVFGTRYGRNGYFLGYVRVAIFIVTGLAMFVAIITLLRRKERWEMRHLFINFRMLLLKSVIIIGTLFLFVMPIYATIVPILEIEEKGFNWLFFLLGVCSLIAMIILLKHFKEVWKTYSLSKGFKNFMALIFLGILCIGSLSLGTYEGYRQLADLPYLDHPATVILYDYNLEYHRVTRAPDYTLLTGKDREGKQYSFHLGDIAVNESFEKFSQCTVQYLPNTKTVISATAR